MCNLAFLGMATDLHKMYFYPHWKCQKCENNVYRFVHVAITKVMRCTEPLAKGLSRKYDSHMHTWPYKGSIAGVVAWLCVAIRYEGLFNFESIANIFWFDHHKKKKKKKTIWKAIHKIGAKSIKWKYFIWKKGFTIFFLLYYPILDIWNAEKNDFIFFSSRFSFSCCLTSPCIT